MLAGKEYGSGSSRDWAAKGTALLGVRAVIAESFERIHRSNLIGMGVLPLQFPDGQSARVARPRPARRSSRSPASPRRWPPTADRRATCACPPRGTGRAGTGAKVEFDARVRIDTPREAEYFRHGGILQYVLRGLLAR